MYYEKIKKIKKQVMQLTPEFLKDIIFAKICETYELPESDRPG